MGVHINVIFLNTSTLLMSRRLKKNQASKLKKRWAAWLKHQFTCNWKVYKFGLNKQKLLAFIIFSSVLKYSNSRRNEKNEWKKNTLQWWQNNYSSVLSFMKVSVKEPRDLTFWFNSEGLRWMTPWRERRMRYCQERKSVSVMILSREGESDYSM